jgi:predicted Fe-Mo cluster-binding NifX family protein
MKTMRIAIAATSSESDAQVARGARAPYYLLIDTERGLTETLINPVSEIERGAGPQAAVFLISKGVSKVVAGKFGPKFRAELESGDIMCVEKTGNVSELIADINN